MTRLARLVERPLLRQFVKFGLVGASSTVVDFSVSNLLYYGLRLSSPEMSVLGGFLMAVANSYFWNSRWTFRTRRSRAAHHEIILFLCISGIGALLNVLIVKSLLMLDPSPRHSPLVFNACKVAATVVVVSWNFFANRHWTFPKHASSG